jgi:hypothetical protein
MIPFPDGTRRWRLIPREGMRPLLRFRTTTRYSPQECVRKGKR